MQDDDFSLFKNEIRGVKPIKHDRADTGKPKADRAQLAKLRQNAIVRSNETTRRSTELVARWRARKPDAQAQTGADQL